MVVVAASCVGLLAGDGAGLLWKSWPVLSSRALADVFLSSVWRPASGHFGLSTVPGRDAVGDGGGGGGWPVPVALLTTIYLSEYAAGDCAG